MYISKADGIMERTPESAPDFDLSPRTYKTP